MLERDENLTGIGLSLTQYAKLSIEYKKRYPLDKLWKEPDLCIEAQGWIKAMYYLSENKTFRAELEELHNQCTSIYAIRCW